MLFGLVGFTAIDVSLCGTFRSQDVLTFAAELGAVAQIGVPILGPGLLPKTADVTGAGASRTLCVKSIGCCRSPPSAGAGDAVTTETASRPAASPVRYRAFRRSG